MSFVVVGKPVSKFVIIIIYVVTILTALSNCNCTVEGGSGGIAPRLG